MRTIGRYEIQKELGRGAMGVVYLANDPRLHRQVAIKTYSLPDGVSEEMAKQFHTRFLREAQAAAGLSHPGIVTIYDAGEDAGLNQPYIAMEFVPGQSLKQRLAMGVRLDPSWVMSFGAVLADALHMAHQAGIIHRDIKPANILIREGDGAAKIADFGVARLTASDLTQTGASLGSPGYMSPEQVKGSVLDGRSDLFSLAVVLYEALSGKRPFHGDDLVSLAYSIAHDTQVPLSRQLQGCPAGLDTFFDRALSKDPQKRFPDGAAFREAFLEAGRKGRHDMGDRTVVDAATVGRAAAAAANLDTRPGLDRNAMPAAKRAGRGRFLALVAAAGLVLAAGVATATYLRLNRPTRLKAENRQARVAHLPPPATDASDAARERHEETASRPKEAVVREVEPAVTVPRMPRNIQLTVPAGAEVHLVLDAPVSSASSHAGETFTATITEPVVAGDRVAIPVGSKVHGRVVLATRAKKGLGDKAGALTLSFDRVATPFGFTASMSAEIARTAPKSTQKTAATIGGSAAGGALLGKVLGGKSKDTAIGTLVGAAVGTGIAAGAKGEDVEFPSGSSLTVTLDRPITISAQP